MVNLANRVTLLRFLLIFIFISLLFTFENGPSLWRLLTSYLAISIFIGAAFTDILDGRIARSRGEVTNFGRLMDPLADKVLICGALIGFLQLKSIYVPVWMVIVIISREVLITVMRSLGALKGRVLEAGRWGKHKTISQMVAIIAILSLLAFNRTILHLYPSSPRPELWLLVDRWVPTGVYLLMLTAVVMTVASGILYLRENRRLLKGI